MAQQSAMILRKQLQELSKHPVPGFTCNLIEDNIYEWDVGIIGSPDTAYSGGYFRATMIFPSDYPFNPPKFRFKDSFFHPNVYEDGNLCISILHAPGDDPISGERAAERWNPTQSVESILISVISLLVDPNCSSPANVDAGVLYRKDRKEYDSIIRDQVEASKKNIPPGFQMPKTMSDFMIAQPKDIPEPDDFWYDDHDECESDDGWGNASEEEEEEEDENLEGTEDEEEVSS